MGGNWYDWCLKQREHDAWSVSLPAALVLWRCGDPACQWVDVEETRGVSLTPCGVQAAGLGGGAAEAGMHCHCIGESYTWYAFAECLSTDYSHYGDFSVFC